MRPASLDRGERQVSRKLLSLLSSIAVNTCSPGCSSTTPHARCSLAYPPPSPLDCPPPEAFIARIPHQMLGKLTMQWTPHGSERAKCITGIASNRQPSAQR